MPIPDYATLMLPLLKLASDGVEHRFRDAIESLATQFTLTEEERNELLPAGQARVIDNRVGWARTYLKQAGLIESSRRGVFNITAQGRALLAENPPRIDAQLLRRFQPFLDFLARRGEREDQPNEPVAPANRQLEPEESRETPEDQLAQAYRRIRKDLASELLEQIKAAPPSFFEQLVVDLLVTMGYGGNRQDAGRAIGKSGDGGIDGIINEDKLGLDVIYIQAKRWDATVGRPEIQKFAGALQGQRARKGVFITTSTFSREAEDFVTHIDSKIILIDGDKLAELMIDHNVGVAVIGSYEIKKLDSDYFEGQ
jgi:restriction system protein